MRPVLILALTAGAVGLPASAHAATFHVVPSGDDGVTTFSLSSALSQAASNGDPSNTLALDAGQYAGGLQYTGTTPLTITGAGQDASGTVISAGTGATPYGLALDGVASYDVSGIRFRVATAVSGTGNQTGLRIKGAAGGDSHVSQVAAETMWAGNTGTHAAIVVRGRDVTVDHAALDLGANTDGIVLDNQSANCTCSGYAFSDLTIDGARYGIATTSTSSVDFTVDRAKIVDPGVEGISLETAAPVTATISDSLFLLTVTGSWALALDTDHSAGTGVTATLDARNVTIVGSGSGDTQGALYVDAANASDDFTAVFQDSLVRDVDHPLVSGARGQADSSAAVVTHWSSIPDTGSYTGGPLGTIDNTDHPVAQTVGLGSLGFVDPAAKDFRLVHDSLLVDAGSTSALWHTGEADLLGKARIVNANRDIGAYEYQRSAPAVSAPAPVSATTGTTVSLHATATDADPGETGQLTYAWDFGDGATATGASVTHAYAAAGDHTVTVTVTDPAGVTGTDSTTVHVTAPTPSGGGGGGTGGGGGGSTSGGGTDSGATPGSTTSTGSAPDAPVSHTTTVLAGKLVMTCAPVTRRVLVYKGGTGRTASAGLRAAFARGECVSAALDLLFAHGGPATWTLLGERRIAVRNGGWDHVTASHLAKANRARALLIAQDARIVAEAKKTGWNIRHRRERHAILRDLIGNAAG